MIIPICGKDASQQWDVLDLQGTLSSPDGSPLTDKDLGTLTVTGKRCSLLVGGHRLEGTVVQEKRHLVILQKRKRDDSATEGDPEEDPEASATEYEVVGVIGRRFLFSKRPAVVLSPG